MIKIFASKWHGRDESVERVHVYEFDNVNEFLEFDGMTFTEKCNYFGVVENNPNYGRVYYRYKFFNTTYHAVMFETKAMNV